MPADEISQIESELRKLREVADHEKIRASGLEKEKKTVEARNEYLLNKLKEASYVYGEAGKRLLYFINNQVNPLVERISKLEAEQKKNAGQTKVLGDSVLSTEGVVKADFTKMDARLSELSEGVIALQEKTQVAIKAMARRGASADASIERRILSEAAEAEKKLQAAGVATDKRVASRIAVLEKSLSAKMNILKERNLMLGKDIEGLSVLRKNTETLDAKMQALVTHITQMRIDMEKSMQKAGTDIEAAKAATAKQADVAIAGMEKRLLSLSAQLRQEQEKAFGAVRLAVEETRRSSEEKTTGTAARMEAVEGTIQERLGKAEAAMKKDFRELSVELEKRMKMIEGGIMKNEAVERDFEKATSARFEAVAGKLSSIDDRMGKSEDRVLDDMEFFKQSIKSAESNLKTHVERLDKAIDNKVTKAVTALDRQSLQARTKMSGELTAGLTEAERKIGLLAKDVGTMKTGLSVIQNINAEVVKRKEENAALQARVSAIAKEISSKSEKDDMMITKQVELMEAKIKGMVDSAESRMVRENVRSFSAARQSLKKDIHTLREEGATMKAEVKNLKAMSGAVAGVQQSMVALDRKVDASAGGVEKLSVTVSSDIEKEALRVSRDITALSARMKADLKDTLAKEKERFAAQSADLETGRAVLLKRIEDMSKQVSAAAQAAQSNAKTIAATQADMRRLSSDVSALRRRYAAEMEKLMKEVEG